MDIFEHLRSEHEQVKNILAKMADTQTHQGDQRRSLLHELKENLLPHQYAEERYFYQILFDETHEDAHIHGDIEEHRASRFVLEDLENTTFDDPAWQGVCKVLKELIEHHIEEEEDETFDIARIVIDSSRARSVGERFEEIKDQEKARL